MSLTLRHSATSIGRSVSYTADYFFFRKMKFIGCSYSGHQGLGLGLRFGLGFGLGLAKIEGGQDLKTKLEAIPARDCGVCVLAVRVMKLHTQEATRLCHLK